MRKTRTDRKLRTKWWYVKDKNWTLFEEKVIKEGNRQVTENANDIAKLIKRVAKYNFRGSKGIR